MASFNRGDYERTFRFALMIWNLSHFRDDKPHVEACEWSIQIMNQCEDVIGQMSERPPASRRLPKGI